MGEWLIYYGLALLIPSFVWGLICADDSKSVTMPLTVVALATVSILVGIFLI